jgi:hypothetical protein
LTWNVWLPTARPLYAFGLAQLAKAAPSSAHWKVEPVSVAVKEKLALVDVVGLAGFAVIVVSGAAVSIVQVLDAAAPVLPAASVALTWKVCEPSASAE